MKVQVTDWSKVDTFNWLVLDNNMYDAYYGKPSKTYEVLETVISPRRKIPCYLIDREQNLYISSEICTIVEE